MKLFKTLWSEITKTKNYLVLLFMIVSGCTTHLLLPKKISHGNLPPLQISTNHRYLQTADGKPFFWLGDTAWLLLTKLDRQEAERYLQDRKNKGFNVIQMMVIHDLPTKNFYGDSPFIDDNFTQPLITQGSSANKADEYDYWDHLDYLIDLAAAKGMYMALVPVWGNIAKKQAKDGNWATSYASFLAKRYGDRPHIVWLNGGDVYGYVATQAWENIGTTLNKLTTEQLITFHPRGREQSSTWFHDRDWLDFNMFQSGHRRYDQLGKKDDPARWKGEDNWKYVAEDLAYTPSKPTIDGEPSYENIPRGLHDPKQGYWTAPEIRRYAYWAVFAGAFGHTYGNNAVMQMHKPNSGEGSYGPRNYWYEAINDIGAEQMQHLKTLMLSRPFFARVPDQSLLAGVNGEKYDYVIATRGDNYAFFYTYTGRAFDVIAGKITGNVIKASWFNPRNGTTTTIGQFKNSGTLHFQPPGKHEEGNDWVLILDSLG